MRLFVLILTAALFTGAPAMAQADDRSIEGFDARGFDRHDRTPDWNYRRGEMESDGAYYDGGRYGPRGLIGAGETLDPWLAGTGVAGRDAAKVNRRFARVADRDRDARLTDAEIAKALAKK